MRVLKDVRYGDVSESQKMDIYLPSLSAEQTFPLLFFIHGGGFYSGDKETLDSLDFISQSNESFVIASINYRLSREAPFPAAIEDCRQALSFLSAHSDEYHINSKVALVGGSAGGNLALLLGTNFGLISRFSRACIVALFPVTDMALLANYAKSLPGIDHDRFYIYKTLQPYFNKEVDTISESELKKASPINYISKDMPRTLLQHGTADTLVPLEQSTSYYQKAKSLGADITLERFERANHAHANFKAAANIRHILAFISSALV